MAIARGEFELHYQPVLDLRTDRIVCFEALLRWKHPQRGLVPPCEFIPLAEETGMILPLGKWAIREACCKAMGWPGEMVVAVNLSPVQFRTRDMASSVAGTLAETGLAPWRLELEITESVLLHDSEANLSVLRELKELGVRIAMDDFGTGYSSLGYLRRFAWLSAPLSVRQDQDRPILRERSVRLRRVRRYRTRGRRTRRNSWRGDHGRGRGDARATQSLARRGM
jgi:EAL domain-containing protein (putative c-di-GMP-specific phosphodiesterase class I)